MTSYLYPRIFPPAPAPEQPAKPYRRFDANRVVALAMRIAYESHSLRFTGPERALLSALAQAMCDECENVAREESLSAIQGPGR